MPKPEKRTTIHLICGKNPLKARSGYASYSYSLCKTLIKTNCDVEIFCLGNTDQKIKSAIGIIHIVGVGRLFSLFKNVEMAGLLLFAPIIARSVALTINSQPKIIWGIGPWSLAGTLVKLFSRSRVIVLSDYFTSIKHEFEGTLSAINVKDYGLPIRLKSILMYTTVIRFYTLLENFLLGKSDKIITHYKSTETILREQFGIKHSKFVRLPYFVESGTESEFKKTAKKIKIISISRQDGRKGINFLLHAFKIMNQRDIKYSAVIAGGGKMLENNKKLAKKLQLQNVKFPGFINNTGQLLKSAHIFAFPSVEEGSSSISVLEAMALGIAIVSTKVDGISEDIEDGVSGLLVTPKDPIALANALEKLITNPRLAEKLGKEAKKQFIVKHNLKVAIHYYSLFLKDLRVNQDVGNKSEKT